MGDHAILRPTPAAQSRRADGTYGEKADMYAKSHCLRKAEAAELARLIEETVMLSKVIPFYDKEGKLRCRYIYPPTNITDDDDLIALKDLRGHPLLERVLVHGVQQIKELYGDVVDVKWGQVFA